MVNQIFFHVDLKAQELMLSDSLSQALIFENTQMCSGEAIFGWIYYYF